MPSEAKLCIEKRVWAASYRSGGVQGGLSNGENIVIKVAFKPTSTIAKNQSTVSRDGEDVNLMARGRHDPCVVPRAVPMVEAMVALVLVDQLLQVRSLLIHLKQNIPPWRMLLSLTGKTEALYITNPKVSHLKL